ARISGKKLCVVGRDVLDPRVLKRRRNEKDFPAACRDLCQDNVIRFNLTEVQARTIRYDGAAQSLRPTVVRESTRTNNPWKRSGSAQPNYRKGQDEQKHDCGGVPDPRTTIRRSGRSDHLCSRDRCFARVRVTL